MDTAEIRPLSMTFTEGYDILRLSETGSAGGTAWAGPSIIFIS